MRAVPLETLYSTSSHRKAVFSPSMPSDDCGLVATGGLFSQDLLIEAYSKGIFPWYTDSPVKWFSPPERLILYPSDFYVAKTFRKWCAQEGSGLRYSADSAFSRVIHHCAKVTRKGQDDGTWLNDDMIKAYQALHCAGIAHSVEIWKKSSAVHSLNRPHYTCPFSRPRMPQHENVNPGKDILLGGLYGVSLGRTFFGESMFSTNVNASKLALWLLSVFLKRREFMMIDCQVVSRHLLSLGACVITKNNFVKALAISNRYPTLQGTWRDLWQAELGTQLSIQTMPSC